MRANAPGIPIINLIFQIDFENLTDVNIIKYCNQYPDLLTYTIVKWKKMHLHCYLRVGVHAVMKCTLPTTIPPLLKYLEINSI